MRGRDLIWAAVLLTSCSSFRKPADGETLESVNMFGSIENALAQTEFVEGNWPKWEWWERFGDEQLNYIVDVALKENPTMAKAYYTIQSASAHAKGTGASLLPRVGLWGQELYAHLSKESLFRAPPSTLDSTVNLVDIGGYFLYEFDFWGKNRSKYQAALGGLYATRAEAALSRLTITVALVKTYISYAQTLKRRRLLVEAQSYAKELFEFRKLRFANGLDSTFNEESALGDLLGLESLVTATEAKLSILGMQINVLMGRSPDDALDIAPPKLKQCEQFPVPTDLSLDLLARRPDLMAALWNVRAKAHIIGASKAAFFPSINLAAYGGLGSLGWSSLFKANSLTGFLLPSINLPLFTGFKLSADLDQAKAEYSIAVFEYNDKVLKAANDVTSGLRMLQATSVQKSLKTKHVDSKETSEQLEQEKYTAGISTKLAVLQRKIARIEDSLSYIDTEEEYLHNIVQLVRSLGGGYGSD